MFNRIVEWFQCCKSRHEKRKHEFGVLQATEIAKDMFQVCEHNNELWLTYNANLVCPMTLFKSQPIETLVNIRNLYIKNSCGEEIVGRDDDIVL